MNRQVSRGSDKEVKSKGPNLVKGEMINIEAKNYNYFQGWKKCTISTLAEETVIKSIIKNILTKRISGLDGSSHEFSK